MEMENSKSIRDFNFVKCLLIVMYWFIQIRTQNQFQCLDEILIPIEKCGFIDTDQHEFDTGMLCSSSILMRW